MSLKNKLLAESSEKLGSVAVELDSIFESVQLDESVKANVSTAFEQAVRAAAVTLAESHINEMAESAEVQLAEGIEAAKVASETKLYEDADKFLTHLGKTWLTENKQAVQSNIKAELFESMTVGLKTLFVENNISIPDEQVDVVAELNAELDESALEIKAMFDKNLALEEQIAGLKRVSVMNEATAGLTDSQRDKVTALVEGLDYTEGFQAKLGAIVEMVVGSTEKQPKTLDESVVNIDEAAAAANFEPEVLDESQKSNPNDPMAAYLKAAARLS
ncbi:head scaffolding protein [Aeromonas phage GomatiRiver_11]|nr:capsid assembly scaffolding protein [Aeromonas phage AhFM11]WBF04177.1 head scaffolding protein [Aeromonas phage GomatiRiver_11]